MIGSDADDLVLFARVAEAGSFSRAAERLGVPKSTVSRRIAALEERFRERLVHRNTRKLTLTDFGLSVLDHARALAAELDDALALAHHRQVRPSGRLRVSLPADLAISSFPRMLTRFVREQASIILEMDMTPRRVDLIGENYDLAVRLGDLPDDSRLAARKLADLRVGLYASPQYLKEIGEPNTPEALLDVHGLLIMPRIGAARGWTLYREPSGVGAPWQGTPHMYTVANSPTTLLRMAEEGFGVVSVPEFAARDGLKRGTLQRLLQDWSMPAAHCWAVFPGRRLMPARTRAFLDALVAYLSGEDTWNAEISP